MRPIDVAWICPFCQKFSYANFHTSPVWWISWILVNSCSQQYFYLHPHVKRQYIGSRPRRNSNIFAHLTQMPLNSETLRCSEPTSILMMMSQFEGIGNFSHQVLFSIYWPHLRKTRLCLNRPYSNQKSSMVAATWVCNPMTVFDFSSRESYRRAWPISFLLSFVILRRSGVKNVPVLLYDQ